jgi:hypothetical protein
MKARRRRKRMTAPEARAVAAQCLRQRETVLDLLREIDQSLNDWADLDTLTADRETVDVDDLPTDDPSLRRRVWLTIVDLETSAIGGAS